MSNSNNSAFPFCSFNSEGQLNEYAEGLTKREYFAGLAPKDPPHWFKHNMRERPTVRLYQSDYFKIKSEHAELYKKFYNDECDEWCDNGEVPQSFKDEVLNYGKERLSETKALDLWNYENMKERYFQWPLYYADNLLKQLEK